MNRTTPAILGGQPAVTLDQTEANRWPILTSEDEAAVIDVMRRKRPGVLEIEAEKRAARRTDNLSRAGVNGA